MIGSMANDAKNSLSNFCLTNVRNHKVFLEVHGRDIDFAKSEQSYHLTSTDIPGRVAQSVTCLATDACLTAIPGVASSIPACSHTFVEIDHEIISTVILLPSADSFKKGCCQLQAKVCARITG